jgi:protein-L-isoaspartate(D-aspartate) O-methyltransferase
MQPIQAYRDFFANYIVRSIGSTSERLIAAFAAVPREHFVGSGPWAVCVSSGYIPTISDDPRLLYQDILIGLAPDRGINNGQPTLHARCLDACAPATGESVLHIGAGTGYYTAVLATLVGPTGRVVAYEIEPDLAARARTNLEAYANVSVICASASDATLPRSDVIYVNAGATHPPAAWLEALNPAGRLLFPLTPNDGLGCMLLVTRKRDAIYAASVVSRVAFIPCVGARDPEASKALAAALESRSIEAVKSLRLASRPDHTVWCSGQGWWLSTAEVA